MGTDRSTPSVKTVEMLHELGVKATDNAEVLLEGAGVLTMLRKGGFPLADFAGQMPDVAETPVGSKPCSAKSAAHLKEILSGRFSEALGEFIFFAHNYKRTLPPEFLPAFFHFCRGDKKLWAYVRPAIGARGEWLLRQNADWSNLIVLEEEKTEMKPPHFSKEETLTHARGILEYLKTNRLVGVEDKKMTSDLKDLAYHADLSLVENLDYLFSASDLYDWQAKFQPLFQVLKFRKEMVEALK